MDATRGRTARSRPPPPLSGWSRNRGGGRADGVAFAVDGLSFARRIVLTTGLFDERPDAGLRQAVVEQPRRLSLDLRALDRLTGRTASRPETRRISGQSGIGRQGWLRWAYTRLRAARRSCSSRRFKPQASFDHNVAERMVRTSFGGYCESAKADPTTRRRSSAGCSAIATRAVRAGASA